ncbi:iron ABC transporter permease [Nostoc sp. TCL240-02]|uniref:FecCD family ABC transporter permease n=1 Tax=Nostoc sp. TCL240-02 TaxID=2572090 RepID=UPI00157F9A32|nr:iron ABC transporter permease [Nostoc sp. TCL240-02]QKQ75143.1 iron ABC transporter permease [Nostoc sp. TCL240-02]
MTTIQSTKFQIPNFILSNQPVTKVLLVMLLITLAVLGMSLSLGDYPVPPADIVKAVLGLPTQDPESPFVVVTLRLPRVLISWLIGVGLAVAGAILQGLTRNPLADPGIVGVNAGAALAAVSLIVLFPTVPTMYLPLAAFSGAFVVACLICLLAGTGEKSPLRLVLVGVSLAAIMGAFTTLMLTFGQISNVSRALVWLAGSVAGKSWEQLWQLLPWLVVFLPLALLLARELDTLQLGDLVAKGLGSRVTWQRSKLLLVSVALAGASVAIAGTIGFVGLMAPHLARRLVGAIHQNLLPVAALIGGLLVASADFLGRTMFTPTELPCGLLTAALGAPYFIYLLYQKRQR